MPQSEVTKNGEGDDVERKIKERTWTVRWIGGQMRGKMRMQKEEALLQGVALLC